MDLLWNDLRFAFRTLARNPGFTAVVLATLALGIGANSAIYSLMDQVLLRPLPVHRPDRLVLLEGSGIWSGRTSGEYASQTPMSQPMYEGLRDRAPVFSGVLAQRQTEVHLHGIDVGNSVDVYVPLAMENLLLPSWPPTLGTDWRIRWLTVMARLGEGVSLEEARAGANVAYAQLLKEDAQTLTTMSEKNRALFLDKKLVLEPGGRGVSWLREMAGSPLMALMGMVGLVLLIACVDPSLSGYDVAQQRQLFDRLREQLAAEPGVRSVSLASVPLMTNSNESSTIMVEGYQPKEDEDMNPNFNAVGPGFFATLGIPLVRGRDFGPGDLEGAPNVAVVSESFARRYFGNEDPLGRRFGRKRVGKSDTEIVGVVRDGKAGSLREEAKRFVYMPYQQRPVLDAMTFYMRSGLEADTLLARVPAIVQAVDPTLPATQLRSMRAQIAQSLFAERLVAGLSAAFGLLATVLAALGLYGVMAYAVSLRTREIGIRMALGANRRTVMVMVLRDVAVLVGLGIAWGCRADTGWAGWSSHSSSACGPWTRPPLPSPPRPCC
jgi:hypothetical protein